MKDGEFTYNAWKCPQCEWGYWWNDQMWACSPRRNLEEENQNCEEDENGNCLNCNKGFYFDGQICKKLSIENCQDGYFSICYKCKPGFDLVKNTCELSWKIK